MSKHTPGPWKDENLGKGRGRSAKKEHSIFTTVDGKVYAIGVLRGFSVEDRALIVAAPKLLGSARKGLEVIKETIKEAGPCEHDVNICVCGLIRYAEEIERTIAEATNSLK